MDLSSLETQAGSTMTVMHPVEDIPLLGGDGDPVTFSLLGIDSEEYRASQRGITNKRLSRKNKFKITAEQLELETIEVLVACTVNWSDNFEVDGSAYPFSKDNAKALYERFPWVREQVDDFIGERANFLRN